MKSVPAKITALFIVITSLATGPLRAQQKTFEYNFTLQGEAASGDYLPFWFYSKKHGIMDINSPGGQVIFTFKKNVSDSNDGFDYGFGATFAGRLSKNSTAFFNQLYGTLAYKALQLKGGLFYETIGTVDPSLSMGSLAISSNAAPIPKIKLGIFHYTDVPFTRGYLEFKGEIAHGWFGKNRFIHNPWLHQKSVYLRAGGDLPVRAYAGLVDEATWTGTSDTEGTYAHSFKDFLRVLMGRSAAENAIDVNQGERVYRLGDHRGIWDFGFYIDAGQYDIIVYRQQIWNDKDGLQFKAPDGLTGLSVAMPKNGQQFVQNVVLEYLYTKNQSGSAPVGSGRNGAGGRDNYYNNYLYRTGWTNMGRPIGNPLFVTAYNPRIGTVVTANQYLNYKNPKGVVNNRIVAQHIGIEGQLSGVVGYKILATHSKNYGTYYKSDLFKKKGIKTAFYSNPEQWSFLTKFEFTPLNNAYKNMQFNLAFAGDFGQVYKNTFGVMAGIKIAGFSQF